MQKLSQGALSIGLMIAVILALIGWRPAFASAAPIIPNPNELVQVVQEIESLDATRSGLASSLEGSAEVPTVQTMIEVCRPVGMRACR